MNGWIFDRLPELTVHDEDPDFGAWDLSERVVVACRDEDGIRYGLGVYIRQDDGQQYWAGTLEDDRDLYTTDQVCAWMPLPDRQQMWKKGKYNDL